MRVYVETYGCTANKGDTELLLGQLKMANIPIASSLDEADTVVVNTCAVKGVTYRRMLSRIQALRGLGKRVVVAGCLPLIDPKSIRGLDAISCRSITYLPQVIRNGSCQILLGQAVEKPLLPRTRLSQVSAIVQISEGCLSQCSYCSVRIARGRLRSFKPEFIEQQVRQAVGEGAKEILITSQDNAVYGRDIGIDLPSLLERLTLIEGNFRIRVGMMNPSFLPEIQDRLVEVFSSPKIYKFLHLPVQSGSDRILQSMRRGYRAEDFESVVSFFRSRMPDLQLVTDIIVGYPGESGEDFRQSCELLLRTMPDKVNISRFSPMPGTEASKLKQLDSAEVAKRSREISRLCLDIGLRVNRQYLGRRLGVLVTEEGTRGGFIGRAHNYKPVVLEGVRLGDEMEVKISGATSTYLLGTLD
jgi:threonylcarbamoyladenosine tRNA methylthiotransferase CDKAL1